MPRQAQGEIGRYLAGDNACRISNHVTNLGGTGEGFKSWNGELTWREAREFAVLIKDPAHDFAISVHVCRTSHLC